MIHSLKKKPADPKVRRWATEINVNYRAFTFACVAVSTSKEKAGLCTP